MQVDNWAVKLAAMACVFRPAGEGETAAASFCLRRFSIAAQSLKREKERGIFFMFCVLLLFQVGSLRRGVQAPEDDPVELSRMSTEFIQNIHTS